MFLCTCSVTRDWMCEVAGYGVQSSIVLFASEQSMVLKLYDTSELDTAIYQSGKVMCF